MTRVCEDLAADIPADLKALEGTGALTERGLEAIAPRSSAARPASRWPPGFRGRGNAMIHVDATTGHDVASAARYGSGEAEVLFDKAPSSTCCARSGTPRDTGTSTWRRVRERLVGRTA
jgi:hypothetical protein